MLFELAIFGPICNEMTYGTRCLGAVARGDLQRHAKEKCPLRSASCGACDWNGAAQDLESHRLACPYTPATCDRCLEEMPQWRMLGHACEGVDMADSCVVCGETAFNNRVCRRCAAVHCSLCFERWREQCAKRGEDT